MDTQDLAGPTAALTASQGEVVLILEGQGISIVG